MLGSHCAILNSNANIQKDRCFSWIVCAASIVSHMMSAGFTYSIAGTMILIQQKHFGVTENEASWIISIHFCLFSFMGPPASWLLKRFTVRKIQIAGGLLTTIGLALSYFSTQPWHAYILFSIITATGTSFTFMASSEILQIHFDKYVNLAFGLAITGVNLSMTILPPVSQLLFDELGYNKTCLVLASMHLLHMFGGLCYIQPAKNVASCEEKNSDNDGPIGHSSNTEDGGGVSIKMGYDNPTLDLDDDEDGEGKSNRIPGELEEDYTESQQSNLSAEPFYKQLIKLMKNHRAVALVLSGFIWNFAVSAFLALTNSYIISKIGISEQEAALGFTILGVCSIVGVIPIGLASRLTFDRLIIHATCSTMEALCTLVIVFSINKAMFHSGMALIGFSFGVQLSNLLAMAYNICGADLMVILLSLELVSEGLGGLIGPPVCSYIAQEYSLMSGLILVAVLHTIMVLGILPSIIVEHMRQKSAAEKVAHAASTDKDANHEDMKGNEEEDSNVSEVNQMS